MVARQSALGENQYGQPSVDIQELRLIGGNRETRVMETRKTKLGADYPETLSIVASHSRMSAC